MGKTAAKKRENTSKNGHPKPAVDDGDEAVFMELSRELKEEGSKLFQRGDYEGAAFKYDKAINLLPKAHIDVAHLRSSVANCYMQMSPGDYHRAIHECNLALEVSPRYSRALLRRARCFEALGRLDLVFRDVDNVLNWEPNNRAALEISERIKVSMEENGVVLEYHVEEKKGDHAEVMKHKHTEKKLVMDGQEERHTEEMQLNQDMGKQGNYAEEKQVKHPQDKGEKHPEEKKVKHGQDKQEKRLEEKQVQHGQYKQETCTELKQVNGVDECQKHIGKKQINGQNKQEKHNEKEWMDNGNKRKHTAEQKIRHSDSKQEKHSAVKPVKHDEDKHEKHIDNYTSVNKEVMKDVKFVFGEDIRCAQMPADCSLSQLREIAQSKFPCLKAMLIKYKDSEGDLVTLTSTEELIWAKELADPQGTVRLYVTEVDPEQELGVDVVKKNPFAKLERNHYNENGSTRGDDEQNSYVDDWMMEFARLFKNHVGFDSDAYLDLHDLGMKLYYEAMEESIASEEAQDIFQVAEVKFQEMTALALFNWGNVHMACARKRLFLSEDASMEYILAQAKVAYEWACVEYAKAGKKYKEAVETKPDFFEGFIALGQQQFEQAKLSWYYSLACKIDIGTEVLELFNHAEDNMEKGMEIWEGMENLRLRGLSKPNKEKSILEKMGLEGYMKDLSPDEAFEQPLNIRSQINILWGAILYERSIVEFNLGLPSWEESLAEAMEKFKISGASLADINVMIKNHCANETTQEGLSFKVEEIVQAWNEMYDAKKWRSGVPSFRLDPIFRRRAPKLHHILEHMHYT